MVTNQFGVKCTLSLLNFKLSKVLFSFSMTYSVVLVLVRLESCQFNLA